MSPDFPSFYPEKLKKISWCVDGKAAGPNRFWNRNLPYSTRGSSLFMKTVLVDMMKKKEIVVNDNLDALLEYAAKCITVYMREEDTQFNATMKKDKDGKQLFNSDEWMTLCEKCGIKGKRKASELLKGLVVELVDTYNSIE